MPHSLAGSRIREARRRAELTQAALAQEVGISASYLNLIEHNRRRIGGALLLKIAQTLGVKPAALSDGGSPTLIADLHAAASDLAGAAPEVAASAEALAGRFPDWADVLTTLAARVRDQDSVVSALSDRLTHDPFLSENVHAMLSHITAIRSTADILSTMPDIRPAQRERFYQTMTEESDRLSNTAQLLANYLGNAAQSTGGAATEEEALDTFLERNDHVFPTLESISGKDTGAAIAEILDNDPSVAEGAARGIAQDHLRSYAADAAAMPLDPFIEEARSAAYDPLVLAQRFGQEVLTVFRRLAVLARPGLDVPRFGLIVVAASGYPVHRRPLRGFPLPRHGNACPLWPLFRTAVHAGQPALDLVAHDTRAEFVTLSHTAPRPGPRLGVAGDTLAAMLFVARAESPFQPPQAPVPVGTSCRICARADCTARVQRQILA